jgi:hypothetical protein
MLSAGWRMGLWNEEMRLGRARLRFLPDTRIDENSCSYRLDLDGDGAMELLNMT